MSQPFEPTDAPVGATPGAPTQEMPAVPPPPGSTGTAELPAPEPTVAAPVSAAPTSDAAAFIPGFGRPQPPAPASAVSAPSSRRWSYGPRLQAIAAGVGLVVLALALLMWGLSVGREPLWSSATLWAMFATVCTLLIALAFIAEAPGRSRVPPRSGWRAALGGLTGLAVFWAFVALPHAASNRGFLLTAAFAAAIAAVWKSPHRPARNAL